MSEREMLQKALTVSAMDYMKTETSSGSKQNEGNCQYLKSIFENLYNLNIVTFHCRF